MRRNEATQRICVFAVVGGLLVFSAGPVVIVSAIKALSEVGQESPILGAFYQDIAYHLYDKVALVSWLWPHAPTPRLAPVLSAENGYFLLLYTGTMLGVYLLRTAWSWIVVIGKEKEDIRNEALHRSMEHRTAYPQHERDIRLERQQNEAEIEPQQKRRRYGQFELVYGAPLLIGVVSGVTVKLLEVLMDYVRSFLGL